jgi:hypothetical protein
MLKSTKPFKNKKLPQIFAEAKVWGSSFIQTNDKNMNGFPGRF